MNISKFVLLAGLLIPSLVMSDEIKISDTETLSYEMPEGFSFKVSKDPDDGFRPALKFSHFGEDGFKDFGFKIFVDKGDENQLNDDKSKIEFVTVDCKEYQGGSVEQKTTVKKHSGSTDAFYCSFTDASLVNAKELMPGQFKNVSVGFAKDKAFAFTAVAFSNEISGSKFSAFLNTLSSLKVGNNS